MSKRPDFIDLRSASSNDLQQKTTHLADLPSPRTGEAPPALSPLDAFALQSRMLAKKFEQKQPNGRRISRLPHLDIANEFGRPRQGYLRSDSGNTASPASSRSERQGSNDEEKSGSIPALTSQANRPVSQYPQFGTPTEKREAKKEPAMSPVNEQINEHEPEDYFAFPRSSSPEAIDAHYTVQHATPPTESGQRSGDSYNSTTQVQRTMTSSTTASTRARLAPPYSPQVRSARSPSSIRSIPNDSGDDYDSRSLAESDYFRPRKLSDSSAFSESQPLRSPHIPSPRPPSVNSEYSIGGSRVPKPGVNFSRPISRSGLPKPGADSQLRKMSDGSSMTRPSLDTRPSYDMRPSVESPARQDSGTSSTTSYFDQAAHTPISMGSSMGSRDDYFPEVDQFVQPAPSYIYAKYSLPRGRTVERDSVNHLRNSWLHQFHFDESSAQAQSVPTTPLARNDSLRYIPPQLQAGVPPNRSHSADDHNPSSKHFPKHRTNPSAPSIAPSASSSSTITPSTVNRRHKPLPGTELAPAEHLDKGIQLHSDGFLKESTYHLRLAAHAGLPTAMLLYALACRHGWGMRASQEEGVQWLKKAVDSASLEVADDTLSSGSTTGGEARTPADYTESKTRKAQFALSIYELGVSYMNGWGVAQDRSLALRCFEIAGNWGDADALAEAGFCYAEGVGCKKDLRKAAKFYRMAEAKGMSMTGNSWIYKEKYMEEERTGRTGRARSNTKKDKELEEKKPRDKSRTRGLFRRRGKTIEQPPQ
ncbi:MAG: hypothetical protein M1820_007262 [Bogoriella megaspora]|nr:MAG: hypothetical protein M1820_007262 [Bogoriella megaspora]